MRPIVVVFVLFAVLMAGVTAFLAKLWLDSRAPVVQQQVAAPEKPAGMVQILVAAHQISAGTKLTKDDIRWADWPKAAVEDRFIQENQLAQAAPLAAQEPADTTPTPIVKSSGDQAGQAAGVVVTGSIARRQILSGEPIGLESIIQPGDHSVVAAILDPGMRAISIPISSETAASGFINPGDHVDVLLASNVRSAVGDSENKKSDVIVNWATETVLHDVKVLAIDQQLSHEAKDSPAIVGKMAMLEVTPADAERLLAAQQLGSLSLVLRSFVLEQPKDNDPQQDTYNDPMLFTADKDVSKGLAALAGAQKGAAVNGDTVRINRGGTLSSQSF